MKVVRFSALRTGYLYPPGNSYGTPGPYCSLKEYVNEKFQRHRLPLADDKASLNSQTVLTQNLSQTIFV